MKLTSFRLFVLLCAACALLALGAVGLTYGASKLLSAQGEKLENVKIDDEVARNRQLSLTRAQNNITKYEELDAIAKGVLPQEKDQARTVREIVAIANQSGVSLGSITFPDSKLGAATKSKTPTNSNQTQLTAVKGITGLYVMEIAVSSSDSARYDNFLNFISSLQNNRRTANITSVSARPDSDNRNRVAFSLTINAYIRP